MVTPVSRQPEWFATIQGTPHLEHALSQLRLVATNKTGRIQISIPMTGEQPTALLLDTDGQLETVVFLEPIAVVAAQLWVGTIGYALIALVAECAPTEDAKQPESWRKLEEAENALARNLQKTFGVKLEQSDCSATFTITINHGEPPSSL